MDTERLIYMANQIATNLACGNSDVAAQATASHIRAYWDPRMRRALTSAPLQGLNDIALRALTLLQNGEELNNI